MLKPKTNRNIIKFVSISIFFVFIFLLAFIFINKSSLISNQYTKESKLSVNIEEIQNKNGVTVQKLSVPAVPGSTFPNFSLEVPKDWKINANLIQGFFGITISKNNSKIDIGQGAYGGGVCVFTDTNKKELGAMFQDHPVETNYKEISYSEGKLRRVKFQSDSYYLCERFSKFNSTVYQKPMLIGSVILSVDKNSPVSTISEMDSIMSTLKYHEGSVSIGGVNP